MNWNASQQRWSSLAGAILVAVSGPIASESVAQPEAFSERLELRLIESAVVAIADGQRVEDLTRADFALRIDGELHPLTHFESPRQAAARPLHLAIFVDQPHLDNASRGRLLRAAAELAQRRLEKGSLVTIVDHGLSTLYRCRMSNNPERVASEFRRSARTTLAATVGDRSIDRPEASAKRSMSALGQLLERLGDLDQPTVLLYLGDGLSTKPPSRVDQQIVGGYQATPPPSTDVAGVPTPDPGRSRVIYVSPPVASAVPLQPRELTLNLLLGAAAVAEAHQIAFYAVAPRLGIALDSTQSVAPTAELEPALESLRFLALRSGGELLSGKPSAAFERLEQRFESSYLLGFEVAQRGEGRRHKIEIVSRRPGVEVIHRRAFDDRSPHDRLARLTRGAALFGVSSNPIDMKLEVSPPQRQKRRLYRAPVSLQIPLSALLLEPRGAMSHGHLMLCLLVADEFGRDSGPQLLQWPIELPTTALDDGSFEVLEYRTEIELRRGRQTLAIGLLDQASGTLAVVQSELTAGKQRTADGP